MKHWYTDHRGAVRGSTIPQADRWGSNAALPSSLRQQAPRCRGSEPSSVPRLEACVEILERVVGQEADAVLRYELHRVGRHPLVESREPLRRHDGPEGVADAGVERLALAQ